MKKLTILIAEDHALIRESLGLLINSDPRFTVVQLVANGNEAVEQTRRLRPDVVVMDINMPGMDGVEATQQIRKCSPSTKVLGISMHTLPAFAKRMFQNGALGYVTKSSQPSEMYNAIIEVSNNRKYICSEIKNNISEGIAMGMEKSAGINRLSKREIEVIGFVKKGYSSKKIGEVLNIGYKTVEAHRYNILKKLELKNTAAMISYINNNNVYTVDDFKALRGQSLLSTV